MSENTTLIIGNKNLSSWSLRPWVLMKYFDISFQEQLIRLDVAEARDAIREFSPSGLVPCLKNGSEVIWDSLAIAEYLNELYPEKEMWPTDVAARTRARSIVAEMHSGFSGLRGVWPMEFCREGARVWGGPAVRKDIDRLLVLWGGALDDFGAKAVGSKDEGPFLFGRFSIADAMFAPVVSRFRTYGPVPVPSKIIDYLDAVWALPAMREWGEGALREVEAGWYR